MTPAATVSELTLAEAARIYGPAQRVLYRRHEHLFAYAIQAGPGGPVKIGTTLDPVVRIKTLQTANAAELVGLAAWRVLPWEEKQLHKQFAHLCIRGEWFEPASELLDHVLLRGADYCDWTCAE